MSSEAKIEPMVKSSDPRVADMERYCLKPIQHQAIYDNYRQQKSKVWDSVELDFSADRASWLKMSPEELNYIAKSLAFFANSDNAVLENLGSRFRQAFPWPEVQMALAAQAYMETVHVESYNDMISAVIKDPQKERELFHAADHHPIIAEKIGLITKWAGDPDTPLELCIAAQCFSEGIGFCPSFASMGWLRKNQRCPGISFANELIMRDESLHVQFFSLLYKEYPEKLSTEKLYGMCRDFVDLEDRFVDTMLPYRLKGMNASLMKQHVRCTADSVLNEMGATALYKVVSPFPWMENPELVGKTNFFEKRVGEYQKAGQETEIQTQAVEIDVAQGLGF
jgi:ribonucleoside-diphosphate reductase beta chain